jgi:hypothetical protein
MTLKVVTTVSPDGIYCTRVVNAETGEKIDNVQSVTFEHDCRRCFDPVVTLRVRGVLADIEFAAGAETGKG